MFRPAQVSEREPGGYEDCAWASGVMLNNAAHAKNVAPGTRHEYEALRVAGGDGPAENPGDGSNMRQVEQGIIRRYKWDPIRLDVGTAFAVIWANLKPGTAAVITGWAGDLPIHYRRWDPNFRQGHSMYIQREDTNPRVWLQNPLAPDSYAGEWISTANLRDFYNGLRGGALFAKIGFLKPPAPVEDDMEAFSIEQTPSIATAKRDTRLYESSTLTGTSYLIPKGHTKRHIGHPRGSTTVVIVGHDLGPDPGKSALFGHMPDWEVKPSP